MAKGRKGHTNQYATLRSALCTNRKRDWSLYEILILKREATEIVKEKARLALDSSKNAEDRKALGVLIHFD